MELLINFSDLHWLSIVIATLISFAIGGLWYSKALLGTIWLQELDLKLDENEKPNMPLIFGGSFILTFIGIIFLDALIGPDGTLLSGLFNGLLIAFVWISTAMGTTYLFSRKSLKLYLIDAGYFIVFYSIAGIILGAWN